MAFDGITLSYVKNELEKETIGLRVDKIFIPSKDELVLVLGGKGSKQIFISASSSSRIYLTEEKFDNPTNSSMFYTMIRKSLLSSRIKQIRQHELDRILYIDFSARDILGDEVTMTLSVEIMGRHSNIILTNQDGIVIDAIKRVGLETSSVRQILPGIKFFTPPLQDKINILKDDIDEIISRLKLNNDGVLSKRILEEVMGVSPILAREIAFKAVSDTNKPISELDENDFANIKEEFLLLKENLIQDEITPTIVFDEQNKPKDYTIMKIFQYDNIYKTKTFKSISNTIEYFYKEKSRKERVKSRSNDILKVLNKSTLRLTKKISKQEIELLESEKSENYKKLGDLVNANMYQIEKGAKEVEVIDLYDENQKSINIKLDYKLSPALNAQKYYKKYKKAVTASLKLTALIDKGKKELEYLESVLESVLRTENEQELELIKEEIMEQGYIKAKNKSKKSSKKISGFNYYISSSGIEIVSGKNNKANDELSLKIAAKDDIWFHAQKMPGSHVVIRRKGKIVDQSTILEAAKIASFHSKARESTNVAVDYTEIKNVRKQKAGKPGMVFYDNYKTVLVTPKEDTINNLMTNEN